MYTPTTMFGRMPPGLGSGALLAKPLGSGATGVGALNRTGTMPMGIGSKMQPVAPFGAGPKPAGSFAMNTAPQPVPMAQPQPQQPAVMPVQQPVGPPPGVMQMLAARAGGGGAHAGMPQFRAAKDAWKEQKRAEGADRDALRAAKPNRRDFMGG